MELFLVPSILVFFVVSFVYFYVVNKKQLEKIASLELVINQYKLNPSQDCKELLAALATGQAVVKIETMDTADIFFWKHNR